MKAHAWWLALLIAASANLCILESGGAADAADAEFETVRRTAERWIEEGSFAKAVDRLNSVSVAGLSSNAAQWRAFLLADATWRAAVSGAEPEPASRERARNALLALVTPEPTPSDRTELWARAQESLGASYWIDPQVRNWSEAWRHLEPALEYWAGSTNLDQARDRYLGMLHSVTEPPAWIQGGWWPPVSLPVAVWDGAARIAQTTEDRGWALFHLAQARAQSGMAPGLVRAAYERVIALGKESEQFDDALMQFAIWLEQGGARLVRPRGGGWQRAADYAGAVAVLRRLLEEFREGETPYWRDAKDRLSRLTDPSASAYVMETFLPASRVRLSVQSRNVDAVEVRLYAIDLGSMPDDMTDRASLVRLAGKNEPALRWTKTVEISQTHEPWSGTVEAPEPVAPGLYLCEVTGPGVKEPALEWVTVTDAILSLQQAGGRDLLLLTDAHSGAPLSGANVQLCWHGHHNRASRAAARTDAEGRADVDRPGEAHTLTWALAAVSNRVAWVGSRAVPYFYQNDPREQWKVMAFCDRPAFRPGDRVEGKWIVRRQLPDGRYETPRGEAFDYAVLSGRGEEIAKGSVTLNAYGSAALGFVLSEQAELGMATLRVTRAGLVIASSEFFRVEEFKLPEFRVSIALAESGPGTRAYRLGETVGVDIVAERYSGGPVPRATVEVVVSERAFHFVWPLPVPFPWLAKPAEPSMAWREPGQEILRRTLTTDAEGRATLSFETPDDGRDREYEIEARVTDASRREVVGTDSVRVTMLSHFVRLWPETRLINPGDAATIRIEARNADNDPVAVEGRVTVHRTSWKEIWIDPLGSVVPEGRVNEARAGQIWPPPGWWLRSTEVKEERILDESAKTAADGSTEFTFRPERDGVYEVRWRSPDGNGLDVEATTAVWVASDATRDLGVRGQGVEILADLSALRSGDRVPLLITTYRNDRHVWLTSWGRDLIESHLIQVPGSTKLVWLTLDQRHVPNFALRAVMVSDLNVHQDEASWDVPPVSEFLTTTLTFDRTDYMPGDTARVVLETRDHAGKPVAAETALTVFDEAVEAIQPLLAADPRAFFYGERRMIGGSVLHSIDGRPFRRAEEDNAERDEEAKEQGASLRARKGALPASAPVSFMAASGQVAPAPETAEIPMSGGPGGVERRQLTGQDADAAAASGNESFVGTVEVRTDFRSTAHWEPFVETGEDGRAEVSFKLPDSLTTWKAVSRSITQQTQVGGATAAARANRPISVRLQAPRFFQTGDRSFVSALVVNTSDRSVRVRVAIEAKGVRPLGRITASGVSQDLPTELSVDPGREARVDWELAVEEPGTAWIKVVAAGTEAAASDAMERQFPIYERGIDKLVGTSGKLVQNLTDITLPIPAERRPGSARIQLQLQPSLAVTMLDALPYLIRYPYGCTEQTLSRFVPAAIVAKTVEELKLDPAMGLSRVFGGIEPAHAGKTHPAGPASLGQLTAMIETGLARLRELQHSSGGWGWWPGDEPDLWMSAYAVWSLALAQEAGSPVPADMLSAGVAFLNARMVEAETAPELHAFVLHARLEADARFDDPARRAWDALWKRKDGLSPYARALLTLAAIRAGQRDAARILVENLENGAQRDATPDQSILTGASGQASAPWVQPTVHWGKRSGYWRWQESGVESTAFVLRALLAWDPKHPLVQPAMMWLVKNRRGAQWTNTRDSALAVLALCDYLRRTGEGAAEGTFEVSINGRVLGTVQFGGTNWAAPSAFAIEGDGIVDGPNTLRVRRTAGEAPIYFSAAATFFTREQPIPAAGNEIFVKRQYLRLTPRETLLRGFVYERQPLADGAEVRSGDRIETVVTIETKNDLEYLVFEDLKPAGFEAVEVQSGYGLSAEQLRSDRVAGAGGAERRLGSAEPIYRELRDRKVALFARKLGQGFWEIRHELRAETPGRFSALPLIAHAMYVPEVRANSDECRVIVKERGE